MGYSSSGSTCSSMGFPWTMAPSEHVHLPQRSPFHGLQCGCLQGESLLGHLEHLLLFWLRCLQDYFSHPLLSPHSLCSIWPFLTWHCHCGCRVQLCLVVSPQGMSWNRLCSAWGSPHPSSPRPLCSTPSTLYMASTTMLVQLKMRTKADPVCMERQEKPLTSHTELTGKTVTMPQSGSPWFPMKQEVCILSEYNRAAVASRL